MKEGRLQRISVYVYRYGFSHTPPPCFSGTWKKVFFSLSEIWIHALFLHCSCLFLHCFCTVSALFLYCFCLFLHCFCTVSAQFLYCFCTVFALFLYCFCTVSALFLYCFCTVSALFLHCSCTVCTVSVSFLIVSVCSLLFLYYTLLLVYLIVFFLKAHKRTEFGPSQFDSSRERNQISSQLMQRMHNMQVSKEC